VIPDNSSSGANSRTVPDLERIGEHMFRLTFMFWAWRRKNRVDDPHDLTESEFVALDTLVREGTCTVGQLQKVLQVQPAQMSRIIRSLEAKGSHPFVECQLNPKDKRKINVSITTTGRRAHQEYRARRIRANAELLADLSEDEQADIVKLLGRYEQIMSARMASQEDQDDQ